MGEVPAGFHYAVASSIYLINDLFDLRADRRHVTKSSHPLASGLISIPSAIGMIAILLQGAGALSTRLPLNAAALVFGYSAATLFYSAVLSRILTLANRGALADDPILFATRDGITYIVVAVMALMALLAT